MSLIKEFVKEIWRYPLLSYMRGNLKNHNFKILSSNCIGGVLLHDLGMRFDTPTINMTIENFAVFVSNYEELLSKEPVINYEWQKRYPDYPCLSIDDVIIRAIHYKNYEEFLDKWKTRTRRFIDNKGELFVITCDAQIKTKQDEALFLSLPYPKVCFTNKHRDEKEFVYIPGFDSTESVGDLNQYCDITGKRYFEKYFDCVNWLNHQ